MSTVTLPSDRLQTPWETLWSSFERGLRANPDYSPRTIEVYRDASSQFHAWLASHGFTADPAAIERRHVEEFLIHLRETPSARTGRGASDATVRARFSALRRFFNWLEAEEEIERSPMARMRGPKVAEKVPDVLTEEELVRLLKACDGKDFEDRRDAAIIRLLADTGLRRFEVAGMTVDRLDLEGCAIHITSKGGREEVVFFGAKTAAAIDRYLRARARHPHAGLAAVWLAQKGALTGDGVHYLIQRRARLARIERTVWPHLLRHTWAHSMKSAGASDEDVMTLGRWRDRSVMARYGKSAAVSRARETHRRLSPGDRL